MTVDERRLPDVTHAGSCSSTAIIARAVLIIATTISGCADDESPVDQSKPAPPSMGIAVEEPNVEIPRPTGYEQLDAKTRQAIDEAMIRVREHAFSASSWAHLGRIYHAHTQYPEAIAAYARAVELQDNIAEHHYLLALVQHRLAHTELAIESARRARSLEPTLVEASWRLGDWCMEIGELGQAEQHYRDALTHQPDHIASLTGLARVHLQLGRCEQAIEILQPLRDRSEAGAQSYVGFLLARALRRCGQHQEAQQFSKRAIVTAPKWPDRMMDRVWQEYVGFAADRRLAFIALNHLYAHPQSDRIEEVTGMLEALRDQRRNDVDVLINLSICYRMAERYDDALQALQDGRRIQDSHNKLQFHLAATYRTLAVDTGAIGSKRDTYLDKALMHATRSIELNQGFAGAYGIRAEILKLLERPVEALEQYQQAMMREPDNPQWPFQIGHLHDRARRFDQAAEAFQRAVEVSDDSAYGIRLLVGQSLANAGRLAEAAAEFRLTLNMIDEAADARTGQPSQMQSIRNVLEHSLHTVIELINENKDVSGNPQESRGAS